MNVRFRREAAAEFLALPAREQAALTSALRKLEAVGEALAFPHSSAVRGASAALRELRPRQGRSRWRAFYRRLGDDLVIAAIGPEAAVDARGFGRAVEAAVARLADEEEGV
ncbi:MAG: type II toxin-antitoxin system RelE/ParE family toxin [Armatimonadetes bacterium]|nr:type II toxin-antitoxin system RelE/ParE family toxin [Armatimonadota bacterium]